MKENQNRVLCDLNDSENNADLLASEINGKDGVWNMEEAKCNMFVEDICSDNENGDVGSVDPLKLFKERNLYTDGNSSENEDTDKKTRQSVSPCTIPSGEKELCEKNTGLYTVKNAMPCELPELVVCYEENTRHVVKDICVDEGVPFEDKILIESENDKGGVTVASEDINFLSADGSKLLSETDSNKDEASDYGAKEKVGIELLLADALQSLLDNDFDHDISTGEETDKIADEVSRDKFVTSTMPSLQKFSKYQSLKSLVESPEFDGNQVEKRNDQIQSSEAKCEGPVSVSAAEESSKSSTVNVLAYNSKVVAYNSKVENATITFDFNSLKSAAICREDNPDDANHERLFKTDSVSHSSAIGSESQRDHGESSFSMAGPVSGLITFSGPMTSSCSVSLRSDSSTTSTRSFAFPILQSEWNSSPVRMAKADRRRYPKHRGWRQGLLCCRF
ncbi:Protein BREAKING OF ASYMMETRY IN THE STOMATAL LINEAGE like [Actinidia chinensis var. chinensis]|uniref:Protein BREAKING OF ASYMMETRY IN THE STOMATAL LINEAGE like n=1 Tax=Actinidia chinensis var. chinensis TaxID=1590841 RepID=A0A2R6P4H8_ACTCC|nr:Protein BREAKING OF ASYMMETRY IN THE STOMATAL LINEAGE like [Actinidia chinensis var. chinensis]